MSRALLALVLSGCVTTAAIARRDRVTLPLLIGTVAADLVVTSLVASQIQDYSTAGAIATGLAVTAVDLASGCLLDACAVLRP